MICEVLISLSPAAAADDLTIKRAACTGAGIDPGEVRAVRITRKSVDARRKNIRVNLTVELLYGNGNTFPAVSPFRGRNVTTAPEVIVVGAGPAGLFASLRLIESGIRPVIIERGRDIPARKRDIAGISRYQTVDPDSNYCFGEGGAGTFSDGKLYTRSKKRGDNSRVLELLFIHGAGENILYEAHPHLGTDKLPGIIASIKKSITEAGGIILLRKKVVDFILEGDTIKGIVTQDNERFLSSNIILATGHSARDIYDICAARRIELEIKPFAAGVRAEHPQELIDRIQYHGQTRGEYLPAASYNLVRQIGGRGVYSFCMCPGGFIVPSATAQDEVVVNGMSPSRRNSPYANSGIVVEIRPDDLVKYSKYKELAGIMFQKDMEREAWKNGGQTQHAPAQRLTDFVSGSSSGSLPSVSYTPGIISSPLHEWLPEQIGSRLREGFRQFGKLMKGYLTGEAVILGVETRTSSPVRIPRNVDRMNHLRISGLYPCGEGSGYAGGIVSSAVDGMRAAEAVAAKISGI
jgi:uncharacterized FAD-dependent dehydrogenase